MPNPAICLPLPDFPEDFARPPGPGWEWRGVPDSKPGGPDGNRYNPDTEESLHPDLDHPPPIGPHVDYRAPDGQRYRWFRSGDIVAKT